MRQGRALLLAMVPAMPTAATLLRAAMVATVGVLPLAMPMLVVGISISWIGMWRVHIRVCYILLGVYRTDERHTAILHVFWVHFDVIVRILFDVGCCWTLGVALVCHSYLQSYQI